MKSKLQNKQCGFPKAQDSAAKPRLVFASSGVLGFLILSLLCLSVNTTFAQNGATEGDKLIQDIRVKCTAIDAIRSYRKVQIDVMNRSTEGGVIVGYFDGNELKKIVGKFYGEIAKQTEEYYFWKGKLIFILSKTSYYKYPITYDHVPTGEVGRFAEERYYFKSNKMIRWVKANGKLVSKDNPEYYQQEEALVEEAHRWIIRLRKGR